MHPLAMPAYAAERQTPDSEEIEAHIPVSCTAKGADDEFQFEIKGNNSEKPAKNVLYLRDGQTDSFDFLFQVPGTYSYEISQTPGTNDNILYDKTVYAASIYVTEDDEGTLTAETIVYAKGSDNKSSQCSFINKFPANGDQETESETEKQTEKQTETDSPKNGTGGNQNGGNSGGGYGGGGTNGATDATQKGMLEKLAKVTTGDTSHAEFYAGIGIAGMLAAIFAMKKKGERRK